MAQVLSEADRSALAVLLDGLIPADAFSVGAVELGVLAFIERELAAGSPDLSQLLELAGAARTLAGGELALASLGEDAVAALLAQLNAEHPAAFELLRRRAIEGAFGDPSHGGNREGAGWQLLGYPGPKGTFTAADQELR
ncbi:MAG: hypothetical protein F2663_02795 [Actinobacteria bacterium]|uniref:Unannotated protein n=1 Tax=freshwater metagenome TaxID=449393 RepID=A0A6J6NR44_9ZZZZ|nr:hypothetical protein [Actinomycetota bacterium]